MTKDINEIQAKLIDILKEQIDVLKISAETENKFEVSGTIEAMQGKKKVDGIYFASVVPKPKDVRFYFFPTYTHKEQIGELPENLKKALKGKSCFHVKYMDDEFEDNIKELVETAVKLYQADGLLAK
ncbi:DUF1801 domain-containing protein [Flavobacteriaceae bacterium]|jgi:hypothetical protein|nr:DUF1801 domain-containing protein [Flavobacteriaceae bacterium]MDB2612766.1 DUF1801 domain-containing protein [Flavobacteriaceae bacterium]MDB4497642.1 DUF1801 domain-containing protein [Flavobacteriaceae bacterium]MDC0862565.1 hypothetical protein [Flavobacteriaceae bacterium]MDC3285562.1 DUF1801 domain-containing protein [Flavobacteriaceae bacterium]